MSKKISINKFQQVRAWIVALSMRTKVIAMIGILFLLIVIVLIYLVGATKRTETRTVAMDNRGLSAAQIARRDADVAQAQREGAVRDQAKEATGSGDLEKAASIYKSAVDAEAETAGKVRLILDHSGVLYTAGKYAESIAVAREAESIGTDQYLVADWLSRLYEDQKDYKKAAEYYTIAAKWAKSSTNRSKLSEAHYKSQAQRVSALVGQ